MENKEEIKSRLQQEGYGTVREYNDLPNEEFPDHDHLVDELIVVLKGSMAIKMHGKSYLLKAGDELYFPAKIIHSAKVGSDGCAYILGEKL